jgi:hypothetical protein
MKKIMILGILLFFIQTITVFATTFTDYYPGGKNYIDPLNMSLSGNTVQTISPFKVKPDTDYILHIPGFDWLGENTYLTIEGTVIYIDDYADSDIHCNYSYDDTTCMFHTNGVEDYITILITSDMLGLYYNAYELDQFQFEEGIQATAYEPYIVPYIDTTSPIFDGLGVYIKSYETSTTLLEIIQSHIIAYDEIDGDLTSEITIDVDNYTGFENIVGEYHNTLSVTDSSGNKATFDLVVLVKDEINPVIILDSDIYVDVNDLDSLNTVFDNYLIYNDGYDVSPTLSVLTDEYSSNIGVLGEYLVSIQVEDGSSNYASASTLIHVLDYDSPVLESDENITTNIDSPATIEEIVQSLVITDNYDSNITVSIGNDDYTPNKTVVGIYSVELVLEDTSGNQSTYFLFIHNLDTVEPVFGGSDLLQFSYTNPLTLNDIIEYLTVSDNYDVLDISDSYIVSDTYSNRTTETGQFEIIFAIDDSSGNTGYKIVTLDVFDDVSPVIFVDQYIVVLEEGMSFGKNDAYRLLLYNNELQDGIYEMDVLENEYEGNVGIPGNYLYKIQFTNIEGEQYIKDFVIHVDEGKQANIPRYVVSGIITFAFALFVVIKIKN